MPKKSKKPLHIQLGNIKSQAGDESELSETPLEQQEDFYLSKLADAVDKEGLPTYTHCEAWKYVLT